MEGLLSGISSGAALAATIKIGERKELMNKRLIVILPSFGERYLSTAMFESNTSIKQEKTVIFDLLFKKWKKIFIKN